MITSQQLIDWGKKNGKDVSGLDAKFGALGQSKANSYWNKNNANHNKYINLFKDWQASQKSTQPTTEQATVQPTPTTPSNTPSVSLSALEAASQHVNQQSPSYAPYYTADTPGLSSYRLTDRNTYNTKDYSDVSGLYDYIVKNSTAGKNNPLATIFTQYNPDMFDGSITGRENFIKLVSDNGINNHLGYRDRGRLANFINTMLHDRVAPMKDAEAIWTKYKPLVQGNNTLSDTDYNNLKTDLNGWKAKYYQGQKLVNTYLEDQNDNIKNIMSKIGGVYQNGSWYLKNGGMINYYQQGGAAAQDPQQQIIALVQAAMQGDKKATQQIQQIQAAAEQGDKSATQIMQYIQQIMQQMQQQAQKAKQGAKLQYLAQLRGECPEGTHMTYYKAGGQICKKCVQNQIQQDKCGGKAKKKMACGGATKTINSIKAEMEKCGGKMKNEKCGGKMKKEKCGGKMKKNK